jgi:hypothetical protein
VLEIVLSGPEGPQPPGNPVHVEVRVRNRVDREVWAVGVLDGSEDGVRYPAYRPVVTHGGVIVAQPGPPEDPLVGPLRTADFRRLAPGDEFDPTGPGFLPLTTFANFAPDWPGVYSYALTLSTESPRPEAWLGRFGQDPDVLGFVERVPRVTVTAAPLDIEIR